MPAPSTKTRALSIFEDYVHALSRTPRSGPPSLRDRAAAMLNSRLARAAKTSGANVEDVLSKVQRVALDRSRRRPPPIYVAGVGGSGSHWLTGMIGKMLPVVNLREAPVPADFQEQIAPLGADEQGLAIDCLHLSYALAAPGAAAEPLAEARFVNSAVRAIELRHREWDPECFVIHLLRDPRDQAACFTFRKRDFRQRHYPEATDDQYIAGCAANNADNYLRMGHSPVRADFVCRYEEMKASAPSVLMRLADALGYRVEPEAAVRAAREYDATLIRSGVLPHKGNLAPAESLGWREETSERQKLILHAHLAEVVADAKYPPDDCLGRPLALTASGERRRLAFPRAGGLGVLHVRSPRGEEDAGWQRLGEARGEVTVEPGAIIKLRVAEESSREAIESLRELPPEGLDSLCFAGNPTLDDALLASCLVGLGDLHELDLARTGIGDDGVRAVASLRRLEGLSLYETGVSPSAVSALRGSLPEKAILVE